MEENQQIYKEGIGFKEFFFKYILRFLIASVISITVFILVAWYQGYNYTAISNGLFIGGAIGLAAGVFSIITNLGFFDLLAYNGSRFRSLMQKYEGVNYHGVYEYTEAKKEKRKKNRFVCVSYLLVGLILIISAIIYTYVGGQIYS